MTSLLLVGKTGCGKSATGNSILGRKVFEALTSASSVTKSVQYDYAMVNEREVKVVDGPGLMDTDHSAHESTSMVCQEIEKAVLMSPDGYDAILIVTDMARFTKEDKDVVRQLKSTFGADFIEKYCILVVTHADNYDPEENGKSLEDWCDDQTGSFDDIKRECLNRIVPFFNKTNDANLKKDQINRLFQFVDEIQSKHGRYTKGLFEAARNAREHMLVKLKEPLLMEETEKKLRLRMQELQELDESNKHQALQKLQLMRTEILTRLREVKDADQGTHALQNVESFVQSFLQQIDSKTQRLQSSLAMEEKMKNLEANARKERAKDLEAMDQLRREINRLKENDLRLKVEYAKKMEDLNKAYDKLKQDQSEKMLRNICLGLQVAEKSINVGRQTYSLIQDIKKKGKK